MADIQEKINVAEEKLDNLQASGNPFRKREFVYRKKLPLNGYNNDRAYNDVKKNGGWFNTSSEEEKAWGDRGILIPDAWSDSLGVHEFIKNDGNIDWNAIDSLARKYGKNAPGIKDIIEDAREYQNNFDIYQENRKYDEWESRNNPVQKTRMEDLESAIAEKKQTPSFNVKGIDTAAYLDSIINKQR